MQEEKNTNENLEIQNTLNFLKKILLIKLQTKTH